MHTRVLFNIASGPVSSLHQCRAPSAFPCSFRALTPSSECTSTGSNLEDFLPLQFQGVSSCQAAEWRNRGAGAWRRAAETFVDFAQLVGAQRLPLLSLDIDVYGLRGSHKTTCLGWIGLGWRRRCKAFSEFRRSWTLYRRRPGHSSCRTPRRAGSDALDTLWYALVTR